MNLFQSLNQLLNKLTIPLGRWVGVPVYLHWSWVILFAIILLFKPEMALVFAALFFIFLLHECGHCLAGHYYGCHIRDIVLYPFGGAAAMVIPEKPKQELVVALAGPLVNVLLIPPLWLLSGVHQTLATIALYNVVILVFNLVPAFPMDGGRVLRSLLTMAIKDRPKATAIAARIGQGFAILFVVLGVIGGGFGLSIVGVFIFMAAEQKLSNVRIKAENDRMLRNFLSENQIEPTDDNVRQSADILRRAQERMERLERQQGRRG